MVCTQNTARRHKRGVFNRSDRNFGHAQSYRAIEKVKNQRPMLLSAAVVGVRKARVGGGGRGPLGFWESATVSWSRASVRSSKARRQQKSGIRKKNLVNGRRHLFRLPEGMEQA